jgi:hypothetical protein
VGDKEILKTTGDSVEELDNVAEIDLCGRVTRGSADNRTKI